MPDVGGDAGVGDGPGDQVNLDAMDDPLESFGPDQYADLAATLIPDEIQVVQSCVEISCYRFVVPAQAFRGSEAPRLATVGLHVGGCRRLPLHAEYLI